MLIIHTRICIVETTNHKYVQYHTTIPIQVFSSRYIKWKTSSKDIIILIYSSTDDLQFGYISCFKIVMVSYFLIPYEYFAYIAYIICHKKLKDKMDSSRGQKSGKIEVENSEVLLLFSWLLNISY